MQKTTNECRVCLENVRNFKEFTEILICDTEPQESILSIFEYSTSIDCSNYLEEGPMFLCISCIKNLKFVYDFIRQARESDEKLRNSSEVVAKPTEEIESVCEDEETSEFLETDTTSEIIYVTQPIESVAEYHSPDIIEEEFVLRAESESFLESLNEEENFMEHVAEEKTQVQQEETNEKRICKRKPYVPRKDIPANFNCVHCDKNFVHNFLLKAHIRQYHEPGSKERNWQCSKCDKKFFKKEVLSRHLLTVHREGRDFKCNICGKEFQYKERLTRHLRIHIDRKFQCHICDKSYVQNADLNVHMRTHTNEKPFKCDQCEEAFTNKSRLTVHINRRHLDLIYKCKYCSIYECKSYGSIRRHEIEHLKCPFQCPNCDKGFSRKKRFQEHLLQAHECEMTEEAISNMYIQNMNEARRIELELKNMETNESGTSLEQDLEIEEDYHMGIDNDPS